MIRILFWFGLFGATAHADPATFATYHAEARAVQDAAEAAYAVTGVITDATMTRIATAVDRATGLLRRVAAEPALDEDERGKLYDEVIRGEDGNDERGSLARLFWATVTHHGADDVHGFTGRPDAFTIFRRTLWEAFVDAKSAVTFRRDDSGVKIWAARERRQREKIARALVVRLADVLHGFDALEKRSEDLFDHGYALIGAIADPVVKLRRERVAAERLVGIFYGAMIAVNVFVAPMVLPFVQIDYVGWLTGFAWGSSVLTGGTNVTGYVAAAVTNLLARTRKTYLMLLDLERMAGDPGPEPRDQRRYQTFRDRVRDGRGALGGHRRRMIAAGYRPESADLMSCEDRLRSAVN